MYTRPDMRAFLRGLGALDARALGLLRIGTGVMVIADVVSRIGMAREHYSDAGLLPRSLWHALLGAPGVWSLHLVSGEAWVQVGLLMLTALIGLALALGVRTRLCTTLAWILIASIQARNPDINHGGDVELRLILFWAIFLPWGRRYTLAPSATASRTSHRSPATIAYSIQIALVYFASALLKNGPHWTQSHTAVYYTLNIAGFARPAAHWIAQSPGLASALTVATLAFEFVGPIALLLSGAHWRLRSVVLAGFVSLHLGFALCMPLSPFPAVCIVSMLAFLPAAFFDRVVPALAARMPRLRAASSAAVSASMRWAASAPGWLFDRPMPLRWARRLRPAVSAFVLACLSYVLLWNLGAVGGPRLTPQRALPLARTLGLPQHWGMFVHENPASTWLVIVGRTAAGTELDPLTARAPRWQMPTDLPAFYGDFRTGRTMAKLFIDAKGLQRTAYGRFVCREWNGANPQRQLETVEIFWAFQPTPPPGGARPRPGRRFLAQVDCPGELGPSDPTASRDLPEVRDVEDA